jgi:LemA protein
MLVYQIVQNGILPIAKSVATFIYESTYFPYRGRDLKLSKLFEKKGLILLIITIIIVIFLVMVILMYNNLVWLDSQVDAQWNEIKNQDQRKVDLIPELVALLEGYQEFEKGTLENLTALRSGYINATTDRQRANISVNMSSMYNDIRVTFEAYPYLTSIQSLADVQDEVAGTENRIAYSRTKYIENVRDYNVAVRSFPSNIAAGLFGFQQQENLFGSAP